jgi:hypothetical protein
MIRESLLIHMRTVHAAVRKFECSVCGKAFARWDTMDVHVKKVHNGVERGTVEAKSVNADVFPMELPSTAAENAVVQTVGRVTRTKSSLEVQ